MSKLEKTEANANAEPMEVEFAGAVPPRRGKRRNCMIIPGTSNPLVAKLFA